MGTAVGLALGAGGRNLDFIGEHGLFLRLGFERGLQVEGDGKLAALVGASLAIGNLLVFDGRIPPPPATPWEAGLAHHTVAVFHVVETEAGQRVDAASDGDVLVELVLFLDALEVDLEGGSFVFFDLEVGVAVFAAELEVAVEQVGGDDERAAERTVFVSGEVGRCDGLPVGVLKADVLLVVGDHGVLSPLHMFHDTFEIHGLSGPVDGAVGEEMGVVEPARGVRGTFHVLVVLGQQHVVAFPEVDQERVVASGLIEHDASIAVRLLGGHGFGLVLMLFVVVGLAERLHGDSFHGMTGLAVDGHHFKLVGLAVGDEAEVRHLEKEYDGLVVVGGFLVGGGEEVVKAFLQRR